MVAHIAGLSTPRGRRMGHAGAIVSARGESAAEKTELLRRAGAAIVPNPSEFGATVQALEEDGQTAATAVDGSRAG